jgi:hypothetical protein
MSAIEVSVSLSNGNVQPEASKVKLSIVMMAESGLPQNDEESGSQRYANAFCGLWHLIASRVFMLSSWFKTEPSAHASANNLF